MARMPRNVYTLVDLLTGDNQALGGFPPGLGFEGPDNVQEVTHCAEDTEGFATVAAKPDDIMP